MKKIFLWFWFLIINYSLLITNFSFSQTGWFLQTSQTTKNLQDIFFINSQTGWACGDSGRIIKTTNGGVNWVNKTPFTTITLRAIRFSDANYGYVCGGRNLDQNPFCMDDDILAKTTNGGETWITLLSNNTWDIFYDLAVLNKDTAIVTYAGTDVSCMSSSGGSKRTFNSGNSWDYFGGGWMKGISFVNSNTGWVTSYGIGEFVIGIFVVFKTTNTGVNWNMVFRDTALFISTIGKIRFVDVNNGYCLYRMLRKTTNGGINWQKVDSVTTYNIRCFAPINKDTLWIVQNSNNVKRTNNSGVIWSQQLTTGVALNSIYFIDKNTGWIVGNNGIIFKTISGGVTGVQNISSEIPSSYSLEQNYPNPFNPTTKIKFDIQKSVVSSQYSVVTLKVIDILGKEVATLVNEQLAPGTYSVDFDGTNYPSGIYFYRLITDGFSETKRMTLIK